MLGQNIRQYEYFQYIYIYIDILIPPQGSRLCVRTDSVLAWWPVIHFHEFDIQHDYFQKKNVLTIDPTPGFEGVFKDNICACMLLHSSFP